MCAVSAVYNYGKTIPVDDWANAALREHFRKLIRDAMEFDKNANQPDCEDPEKKKWWNAVEEAHK